MRFPIAMTNRRTEIVIQRATQAFLQCQSAEYEWGNLCFDDVTMQDKWSHIPMVEMNVMGYHRTSGKSVVFRLTLREAANLDLVGQAVNLACMKSIGLRKLTEQDRPEILEEKITQAVS